jgi:hypothetical protein
MNKYVTTITIIHEAESESIARQDAECMRRAMAYRLAELGVAQEIGLVRNVSIYRVSEKV